MRTVLVGVWIAACFGDRLPDPFERYLCRNWKRMSCQHRCSEGDRKHSGDAGPAGGGGFTSRMTRPLKCPMRVALADLNGGLAYLVMGLFSYGPDHHFDHHLALSTEIRPSVKALPLRKIGCLRTSVETLPMSGG
jgi:hypothetical protein